MQVGIVFVRRLTLANNQGICAEVVRLVRQVVKLTQKLAV